MSGPRLEEAANRLHRAAGEASVLYMAGALSRGEFRQAVGRAAAAAARLLARYAAAAAAGAVPGDPATAAKLRAIAADGEYLRRR